MDKKLHLSSNKVLGGVCGGIAEYFGLDVSLVRIAWVLLSILLDIPMVVIYMVLWAVLPSDNNGK